MVVVVLDRQHEIGLGFDGLELDKASKCHDWQLVQ